MGIRAATTADAAAIRQIYAPYVEHTVFSFEYEVPSREEMARRIEAALPQFPWLVWEEDGEILGYAYGSRAFAREAYGFLCDLSIYLREDAHRKGLGRRFYAVMEEILRRQGYTRVYCVVVEENVPSCRFHEAMGYHVLAVFRDSGRKFGAWHSTVWYEKCLRESGSPARFPKPWREVSTDDLF
ncbi:MAG: N-acetyltransferase family protein [Oscillospiraceae bacterium]|nr:N-acetyltransferase family protein [Oscillospiraceae bacterium]